MSLKNLFGAKPKETITIKKDGKVVEVREAGKHKLDAPGKGMAKKAERAIKGRKEHIDRYTDPGNVRR